MLCRQLNSSSIERGGDWRGYDESFHTMRAGEGWEWDEMHSQLWLMAAQRPIPKLAPRVRTPFLGRGAGSQFAPGRCYTYNSQVVVHSTLAGTDTSADSVGEGILKPTGGGQFVKQVVPSPLSPARLVALGHWLQTLDFLISGMSPNCLLRKDADLNVATCTCCDCMVGFTIRYYTY